MLLVKMDPVSAVLGVVSGSATLAATALRTVQYLTSLKDIYDRSGIIILDLLAACEAFEAAWDRIHSWSNCHRALPTGPERPDPIFNHILSFLEIGKVVLGSLQADLERFKSEIEDKGKSNGNIKNPLRKRDKTRVVLRDKTFRGHREIISNQVNSLNLLLSTAMLPNAAAKDIVWDILQPVFRKDDETTWTIVQTSISTRFPLPSMLSQNSTSDEKTSILTMRKMTPDNTAEVEIETDVKFDFENDLILAPVYKRVLYSALCSSSSLKSHSGGLHSSDPAQSGPSPNLRRPLHTQPQVTNSDFTDNLSSNERTAKHSPPFTPKTFAKAVRESGCFSGGVERDLEELMSAEDIFFFPKRSLPLHSTLRRQELSPVEQAAINKEFFEGVLANDPRRVAKLLDQGAEIQFGHTSAFSALHFSLNRKANWMVAALLLLYHETNEFGRDNEGHTLIELAWNTRNVNLLHRLAFMKGLCQKVGNGGEGLIFLAARSTGLGLKFLRRLVQSSADKPWDVGSITDDDGCTPLHVAASYNRAENAIELLKLGAHPLSLASGSLLLQGKPQKLPLGTCLDIALSQEHLGFVMEILKTCHIHILKTLIVPNKENMALFERILLQGSSKVVSVIDERLDDWQHEKRAWHREIYVEYCRARYGDARAKFFAIVALNGIGQEIEEKPSLHKALLFAIENGLPLHNEIGREFDLTPLSSSVLQGFSCPSSNEFLSQERYSEVERTAIDLHNSSKRNVALAFFWWSSGVGSDFSPCGRRAKSRPEKLGMDDLLLRLVFQPISRIKSSLGPRQMYLRPKPIGWPTGGNAKQSLGLLVWGKCYDTDDCQYFFRDGNNQITLLGTASETFEAYVHFKTRRKHLLYIRAVEVFQQWDAVQRVLLGLL